MSKKGIRLEYSGSVIFVAKMVSVVSGLVFAAMLGDALLLTGRRPEYDVWFNVSGDIPGYFTLMAGALSFWVTRFAARKKEGSMKTGMVGNLAIASVAIIIYLALVPLIISWQNVSLSFLPVYLVMSFWIVESYSISVLEAYLQTKTPHVIGYALVVQQVVRVGLGYVLIVLLNQPLLGAVVATLSGAALQIAFYFKLVVQELRQRIRWDYIREWLRASVVNIYNVVGIQISAFVYIILFNLGGEGARGRVGAAATIVNVITYSSFLAYALYPKLLAEKKREDIATTLKMVLMFAVPLTAGALALPGSYVTIIASTYGDAAPVLMVLSVDALVIVLSSFFGSVLYGVETVDEEGKLSLRRLTRSRMFIAFSLPYLHSAFTLPTSFYVLTRVVQDQPLLAALYIVIINASARFAMFLIQYVVVRGMVKIDIPWRSIGKYVFAAAVMGVILYMLPHPSNRLYTLAETGAGGLIYLALIMAIDKDARRLGRETLRKVRHRLKDFSQ